MEQIEVRLRAGGLRLRFMRRSDAVLVWERTLDFFERQLMAG